MAEDGIENEKYKYYVKQEQLRLSFEQIKTISLSSLLADVFVVLIFYKHVPNMQLLAWLIIAIVTVVVIPLSVYILVKKDNGNYRIKMNIEHTLVVVGLVGSSGWGAMSIFLFTPESVVYQLIMLLFLVMGAALSTIVTVAFRPFFFATILPLILPFSIRSFMEGGMTNVVIGVIPIIFGGTLIYLYKNINRVLLDSLSLRFQKDQLMEKIKQEKATVEKISKDKAKFIAMVSHDLKQPLYAQGLLLTQIDYQKLDADMNGVVDKLKASVNIMNDTFNDLIDVSRLDAGAIKPNHTRFPINLLFDELVLHFAGSALNKDLRFRIVQSKLWVESDPIILRRILGNLVSNAMRYTHSGGVVIGLRRKQHTVVIQVIDSGCGIPDELRKKIFNEYYQVNSDNNASAFGLGLAIVSQLCDILGHKLEFTSVTGKGSCFSIELPIAVSVDKDEFHQGDFGDLLPELSNKSILMLDDNKEILDAMVSHLKAGGANVYPANSEKMLMSYLNTLSDAPDLLIADYRLGENMTSIEFINNYLNRYGCDQPVLMVTGETGVDILGKLAGSNIKVLYKPIRVDQLNKGIHQLLNKVEVND